MPTELAGLFDRPAGSYLALRPGPDGTTTTARPVATLDFQSEPLQMCRECVGATGHTSPECWACGGSGLVPAVDPFEASIRFRIYAATREENPELEDLRFRVSREILEPEIKTPTLPEGDEPWLRS